MKHAILTKLTAYRPKSILTNEEIERDFIHVAKNEIEEVLGSNGKSEITYFENYGTYLEQLKRGGKGQPLKNPIFEKVGIQSRHTVDGKMTASDMAIKAGKDLLQGFTINPDDKMVAIGGTLSAEDRWPSLAAKTMRGLGLTEENGYDRIAAYDTGAACSGWTFGMDDARIKLLSGIYKKAIVFSSDLMTQLVYKYDSSRILFGDGATAALIEVETPESTGFRIIDTDIATYAQIPKDVYYPTELALDIEDEKTRNRMNLNAKRVYDAGVGYSASFIEKYLNRNGLRLEEFDYVIPHQANGSMLSSLKERLNLGSNKYGLKKLLSNIKTNGNTAASSIPLCLFDFEESKQFKNGDRILMCSFGAGYTLGIVDVEYKK
jgi:3-oxoacyl-[acyl-carrier-protein] synthase-3